MKAHHIILVVLVAFIAGMIGGTITGSMAQNVNTLVIVPSPTGVAPQLAATGPDTNIGVQIVPKGSGALNYPAGIALVPSTVTPQVLSGASDLVIAAVGQTIAPSGPLINGIVLRVRKDALNPANCRLVAAGGNAYNQEVIISPPIPAGSLGCVTVP